MTTKHLWFSSGIAAHDRQVGAHKARLECLEGAINQLGRLRNEWGFDSLPSDIEAARIALRRAYHAELDRKPAPMPAADQPNN